MSTSLFCPNYPPTIGFHPHEELPPAACIDTGTFLKLFSAERRKCHVAETPSSPDYLQLSQVPKKIRDSPSPPTSRTVLSSALAASPYNHTDTARERVAEQEPLGAHIYKSAPPKFNSSLAGAEAFAAVAKSSSRPQAKGS
jgi:hypothetical protein